MWSVEDQCGWMNVTSAVGEEGYDKNIIVSIGVQCKPVIKSDIEQSLLHDILHTTRKFHNYGAHEYHMTGWLIDMWQISSMYRISTRVQKWISTTFYTDSNQIKSLELLVTFLQKRTKNQI